MEKWYGCSTRMYPVTTWCEAIGQQNRASDCQGRRGYARGCAPCQCPSARKRHGYICGRLLKRVP